MTEDQFKDNQARFEAARKRNHELRPILWTAIAAEIIGAFTWRPLFFAGGILVILTLAYSLRWLWAMGKCLRELEEEIK